jgi:acid phosphatase type 7
LNSGDACKPGDGTYFPSCGTQKTWLASQLENNTQPCTLVYFHHPRISSEDSYQSIEGYDPDGAGTGEPGYIQQWWDEMYKGYDESRAGYKTPDVVLNGHAHIYERFVKMNDAQASATDGITQIIVGTGGRSHGTYGSLQPNSDPADGGNRDRVTYGLTELQLEPNSYKYAFRAAVTDGSPTNGTFSEVPSSSVPCNN